MKLVSHTNEMPTCKQFPPFTPIQKSLLLGSMLGDGSLRLSRPNSKGAIFSEYHCSAQSSYLEYKRQILGEQYFGSPIRKSIKQDKCTLKNYSLVNCSTLTIPELLDWFWKFYPTGNGRKQFQNLNPYEVDLFSLAIWYADDGCLCKTKSTRFCVFAIDGQNHNSVNALLKVLNNFDLSPKLSKPLKISPHAGYLRLDRRNSQKFLEATFKYAPPSMLYKWNIPELSPNGQAL